STRGNCCDVAVSGINDARTCSKSRLGGGRSSSQPDLIARHVANFRATLYAASSYLDGAGRPRAPQDMANHAFVGSPDADRLIPALHNMGIPVRAENLVMNSQNGVVVCELLKAGLRIAMLPEILCDTQPGIQKVLPVLPPLQFPIWLVTQRELQTSPRIRIVYDQLARELKAVAAPIGD
ncbi:MAG: LysR substrate-binding domain-containing protein, partial [Pseudomonadota bacterium]